MIQEEEQELQIMTNLSHLLQLQNNEHTASNTRTTHKVAKDSTFIANFLHGATISKYDTTAQRKLIVGIKDIQLSDYGVNKLICHHKIGKQKERLKEI